MNSKQLFAVFAIVGLVSAGSLQCNPRMAGALLGAAIVTAAIIGTAQVLAYHDAHLHSEYCGCARRWHEGRWVYNYGGHWEYHQGGRWYYYQPAAHHPPPPSNVF